MLSCSLCKAVTITNNTKYPLHFEIYDFKGDNTEKIYHTEIEANKSAFSLGLSAIFQDVQGELSNNIPSIQIEFAALVRGLTNSETVFCSPLLTITNETKINNVDSSVNITFNSDPTNQHLAICTVTR